MPGQRCWKKGRRGYDHHCRKNLYGLGSEPGPEGTHPAGTGTGQPADPGRSFNFRQYPSGHCYFALKDGRTLLKCVMFAGSARRLKQLPQNGDQVLGVGRIDLYERDGAIQFYVDMLMPLRA